MRGRWKAYLGNVYTNRPVDARASDTNKAPEVPRRPSWPFCWAISTRLVFRLEARREEENKSKKKQVWRESESRGNVVPILRRYSADDPNGSAWLADYSRNNKLCKNTLPWTPVVIFLGKEKNERKRRRVTNCRRTLANSSPRMTECFSLSFLLPSRSARVVIFHRISFF